MIHFLAKVSELEKANNLGITNPMKKKAEKLTKLIHLKQINTSSTYLIQIFPRHIQQRQLSHRINFRSQLIIEKADRLVIRDETFISSNQSSELSRALPTFHLSK